LRVHWKISTLKTVTSEVLMQSHQHTSYESTNSLAQFMANANQVYHQAVHSMFALLENVCEGALAVDRQARVIWINDKYLNLLGIDESQSVIGKNIEDVIPASPIRQVLETGQPILLDILRFNEKSFVVTRFPIKDATGHVTGAIGFVFYDNLEYLKPLFVKFTQLEKELASAREALAKQTEKPQFSLFLGTTPACLEAKRLARRVARLDNTVLLQGEAGTGKEFLARAIHSSSARAHKPMFSIYIHSIPENLLDAELFGYDQERGEGRIMRANGSTIFLDDVGDLPLDLQAKLLRVLQKQEIEPIGAKQPIKVDVRIIAASTVDLAEQVAQGKFRSDLYFLLNNMTIHIPALREHLQDLQAICDTLLEQLSVQFGTAQRELSACALELLREQEWKSNIREVRRILEQVSTNTEQTVLTAEDFYHTFPQLRRTPHMAAERIHRSLDDIVAEAERQAIQEALVASGGKKARAAKLLGISRAKLYDKLHALRLLALAHEDDA
jgi:transcriptional regulator with PAS, ATPase and Fis domain